MKTTPNEAANWHTLSELLTVLKHACENPESGERPFKLAFTFSGGGAAGAYQAGVLQAYLDAIVELGEPYTTRLTPRLIVGTSTGALNAFAFFVDRLRTEERIPKDYQQERKNRKQEDLKAACYPARIWRAIDAKHNGSAYVVGEWGSLLLKIVTRPYLLPAILVLGSLAALVAGWKFVSVVCRHPEALRAFCPPGGWVLASVLAIALWIYFKFRRSLFNNRHLANTLGWVATSSSLAMPTGVCARLWRRLSRASDPKRASEGVVKEWQEQLRDLGEDRIVELILTSTDLAVQSEALFTLVGRSTFASLVKNDWLCFQVGECVYPTLIQSADRCGTTAAENLITCVVASASIPAVFPSQRPSLIHPLTKKVLLHDFVDGGVLNNAPLHVAIDAGASHVLSFELNDLAEPDPFTPGLELHLAGKSPSILENLTQTFLTLLDLSTREDIRHASQWNKLLFRQPSPVERSEKKKDVVWLYRMAPVGEQEVTLLDFDGHYTTPWGPPKTSLTTWLKKGTADAHKRQFWDATFMAAPKEPAYQTSSASFSAASASVPRSLSTAES